MEVEGGRTRTIKLVILLLIGSTLAADLNTNQAQDTIKLDKCNLLQYIIYYSECLRCLYACILVYLILSSLGGDLFVLFKTLAGLCLAWIISPLSL